VLLKIVHFFKKRSGHPSLSLLHFSNSEINRVWLLKCLLDGDGGDIDEEKKIKIISKIILCESIKMHIEAHQFECV
jgi:hypothetical protein